MYFYVDDHTFVQEGKEQIELRSLQTGNYVEVLYIDNSHVACVERLASENASAFCADGSAMFTIVASSTTMSCAIPMTARMSQRRECAFAATSARVTVSVVV